MSLCVPMLIVHTAHTTTHFTLYTPGLTHARAEHAKVKEERQALLNERDAARETAEKLVG